MADMEDPKKMTPEAASLVERGELAHALNDPKMARDALGAWLLTAPRDDVKGVVDGMRAQWDNMPSIDLDGDRAVLVKTLMDYLEAEDGE